MESSQMYVNCTCSKNPNLFLYRINNFSGITHGTSRKLSSEMGVDLKTRGIKETIGTKLLNYK